MHDERCARQQADENRVPVQNSGFFAQAKIRPQRLEE
jgi:hypothetical protein